ncbi:hypothetical protein ScPMuIL_006406 [Solemya velum]
MGPSGAATNMRKLYWHNGIAERAQSWVDECQWKHDAQTNRAVASLPGISMGQNLAAARPPADAQNWAPRITAWYNEYKDFTYNVSTDKVVGHFTQLSLAASYRIGCGFRTCSMNGQLWDFYYCNYAVSISSEEQTKPWTDGEQCSECESGCDNGLCDCGDKACLNYSRMDLSACECRCASAKLSSEDSFFSGDSCEIVNCPAETPSFCIGAESKCKYSNWPYEYCPRTCGLC